MSISTSFPAAAGVTKKTFTNYGTLNTRQYVAVATKFLREKFPHADIFEEPATLQQEFCVVAEDPATGLEIAVCSKKDGNDLIVNLSDGCAYVPIFG